MACSSGVGSLKKKIDGKISGFVIILATGLKLRIIYFLIKFCFNFYTSLTTSSTPAFLVVNYIPLPPCEGNLFSLHLSQVTLGVYPLIRPRSMVVAAGWHLD